MFLVVGFCCCCCIILDRESRDAKLTVIVDRVNKSSRKCGCSCSCCCSIRFDLKIRRIFLCFVFLLLWECLLQGGCCRRERHRKFPICSYTIFICRILNIIDLQDLNTKYEQVVFPSHHFFSCFFFKYTQLIYSDAEEIKLYLFSIQN